MSLNWDHIRYFIAVTDQGSVSRAAQTLDVSHATVLRAIERLERSLQLRLFDHVRSGYRVTEDGLALLQHARAMAAEAQRLQVQARARDSVPSGELNLALPDQSLFPCMVLLHEFGREHPNITINFKSARIRHMDDFLQQGVDLLLLVSNDAPDDFVGRQLCRIGFGVYAGAGSASTDEDQKWVKWTLPGDFGTAAMDALQAQLQRLVGAGLDKVIDAGSHDNAVAAIRAGLGVGLVAQGAASNLVPMSISGRIPDWGLWCLTHPDFRHTARVSALMRHLADALSGN